MNCSGNLRRVSEYLLLLGTCAIGLFSGCSSETSEFFDKKHVELHSKDLIREISEIQLVPDVNRPLPDLYRSPPEIITNSKGTKLFYFTRHHNPPVLEKLISSQLGYKVSVNAATNQLVVECPNPEEAQITIDFLEKVDVPPVQVRIDCLISELFSDMTLDWETTLEIDDLFGTGSGGLRKVGDTIADAISLGDGNPTFTGAAARDVTRRSTGLKVEFASSSGSFDAVIDLLLSRGYLKIVMNPTLRTINGKKAMIKTTDQVPVVKTITPGGTILPYDVTEYKDVIDLLEVVPWVYADGSIGLATKAMISSRSTPEGASQKTIITEREITTEENRIRPGGSLIIGGIRKSETLGIVRGVPFLKDLPILGVLFSSKDEEERVREILFILTPSISDIGTDHAEMVAEIRRKHAKPVYKKGLLQSITDPLGSSAYTDHVERKALESETQRIEAETRMREAERELTKAEKQIQAEKHRGELARLEAQEARSHAEKVKAEADKAKAETALALEAKRHAEQAKAEAEKKAAEAMKAEAEALKRAKESTTEKESEPNAEEPNQP
ncbi:MAG: hypothetical protein ABIG61_03935 [Planctomycetota bacterium]